MEVIEDLHCVRVRTSQGVVVVEGRPGTWLPAAARTRRRPDGRRRARAEECGYREGAGALRSK